MIAVTGELFEVYDENDNWLGFAPRSVCHGDPDFIHRTSHVVVFHPTEKAVLLQKRAANKDIQPGKWDTSVGGHVHLGEDYLAAARRELTEELGIDGETAELKFLFDSKIRNEIESENVRVFSLWSEGPFQIQREELDEVRFWSFEALKDETNYKYFTPNLVLEIRRLLTDGIIE